MRENTRTKGELLVEVFFGPAVVAEFEFGGHDVLEVGVENAERIKVSDMVAADLVCSNQ